MDQNYVEYLKEQLPKKTINRIEELDLNLGLSPEIMLDFADEKKRWQTEIPFLLSELKEYEKPHIYDACLGTGATSIGLKKIGGIEWIISNEIDENMIKLAKQQAKKNNVNLDIFRCDWRDENVQGVWSKSKFDSVLLLGNSLTYLFKRYDQLKALDNFYGILKKRGKMIIDERNYAEKFLKNEFTPAGNAIYCGVDKVEVKPILIEKDFVVMEYTHKKRNDKCHLVLYPFKKDEMKGLIEEAGFKIEGIYGDYKLDFEPNEPDFITYVCRK